jgi:hypothetical protein
VRTIAGSPDQPDAHRDDPARLEPRLQHLRSVCGCKAAAVASVSTLAAYTIFILISTHDDRLPAFNRWLLGFGSAVVAGTLSKLVVIAQARYRLWRIARQGASQS